MCWSITQLEKTKTYNVSGSSLPNAAVILPDLTSERKSLDNRRINMLPFLC